MRSSSFEIYQRGESTAMPQHVANMALKLIYLIWNLFFRFLTFRIVLDNLTSAHGFCSCLISK